MPSAFWASIFAPRHLLGLWLGNSGKPALDDIAFLAEGNLDRLRTACGIMWFRGPALLSLYTLTLPIAY